MRLLKRRRFWLVLLLPLTYGLTSLAQAFPQATEQLYSRGLYPATSRFFARVTGLLPFSLAEWFIYGAIAGGATYLGLFAAAMIRGRTGRKDRLLRLVADVSCVAGLVYLLFSFGCGFNYHRVSFSEYSGLQMRDSSTGELAALCSELVSNANQLHGSIETNSENQMVMSFASFREAAEAAAGTMDNLAGQYDTFAGYTPRPKPVLNSRGMSHLDIVGVFTFYTYEANINTDVPHYSIPSSMIHELAHYKGYMREDEANFIAYLGCRDSAYSDFAYSGTLLALVHSSNALYRADKELYGEVMDALHPGIRADFAANRAYWKQFEGPVSEVSSTVNDVYLKTNKQADGVKSYGRMVDLLLADYRQRHALD